MAPFVMPKCAARLVAGAGIAVAAMLACARAEAVEIVNRDKIPREIVVNTSDGDSIVRTLKPQEKVADICAVCVILTGDTSVEARGDMTVMIEGGKVSVGSKR